MSRREGTRNNGTTRAARLACMCEGPSCQLEWLEMIGLHAMRFSKYQVARPHICIQSCSFPSCINLRSYCAVHGSLCRLYSTRSRKKEFEPILSFVLEIHGLFLISPLFPKQKFNLVKGFCETHSTSHRQEDWTGNQECPIILQPCSKMSCPTVSSA